MKIEEAGFLIIGAGRVGGALGILLKDRGLKVVGVHDKDEAKGKKLSEKLGAKYFDDFGKDHGDRTDVVIISVPDDCISEVIEKIVGSDIIKPGTFVCHTSGVHSSRILEPVGKKGGNAFSLHPLVSITDPESLSEVVEESFFVLEGDPDGIEIGTEIVRALGANCFSISSSKKALYHSAASILSNYLATLFNIACGIMLDIGLDPDDIHESLCSLVGSTLLNLAKNDPLDALTGPVSRGDIETIRLHMEALSEYNEDIKELYAKLGLLTLQMAELKGLDSKKIDQMRRVLDANVD